MSNQLPTAQIVLGEWLLLRNNSIGEFSFEGLSRDVNRALTRWQEAAKAFNIMPGDIDATEYLKLKELRKHVVTMLHFEKNTYTLTRVEASDTRGHE